MSGLWWGLLLVAVVAVGFVGVRRGWFRLPRWSKRAQEDADDQARARRFATTVPSGMWRCPACRTDNPGTVPRCYKCGSLRP